MSHPMCLSVLLCATPALAQTLHTVGPGLMHPDIVAALAAAAPGDVVHVTAGTYAAFMLDKGVTLRAEPFGASVVVAGPASLAACIVELPAGQTAAIEGLELRTQVLVRPPAGAAAAGAVAFTGTDVTLGMTVQDANAVLRDCVVDGFGTALELLGTASVSAVQCQFRGAPASWLPNPCGIRAGGSSSLHVGNSFVRGGTNGFHGVTAAANGVQATGAARAWFVDTDVAAWNQSTLPCAAVSNQSSSPIAFERGSALDNLGAPGSFVGAVQDSLVLGVSTNDQIEIGQLFTLDFRTRPGLPVFVHATFFLQAPVSYPIVVQPDWGFAANSIFLAGMVADGQGQATYGIVIPPLPFLQDLQLWFSAWSAIDLPVQLAPVLGGTVR